MDPQSSGPRGHRASARKSGQSGGGRARGKRPQQRPRGGLAQSGQQRFNTSHAESLNSIRSEATATPEAPLLPPIPDHSPAPAAPRPTPALKAGPAPDVSQPQAPTLATPSSLPASLKSLKSLNATKPSKGALAPQAPGAPERVDRGDDEGDDEGDGAELARLRAAWLFEPGLSDHIHNWLADAMPFSRRERARRPGYWRRRAFLSVIAVGMVIAAVLVGNFGISISQQVAGMFAGLAGIPTNQDSGPGSVIISPLNNTDGTPTPGPMLYTVGVWTSNTMPTGGSVKVYVRISRAGVPVAKAKVNIQALIGGQSAVRLGPLTTNSYGMASAMLRYGGASGQGTPIFLTATTTIGAQTYSGTYTVYALG